ncbi:hypothetical protein RS130_22960 [Paraglaciecola aquimarina]|uniref:Glycosyltransferase 2-like domain-containing protein n=1 Tax=Paraglaciecola aquimarina TaxID=1235557 RepID=A0ABU3T271_9ALTE|nr:hypothetical protein [Paraglaciecola aquimarina]MDU0356369.1 hypothetical protein [Paraglaciecola aquimarina]
MLPIRIKQFPNFLKELYKRKRILSSTPRGKRVFHLCYFSCHSYFPYLYCALHSMKKHLTDIEFKVYIFNDAEMPISDAQFSTIQDLIPGAELILWPKSMGWGAEQISNIWKAYDYAAKNAGENDIVARIDSDVFFFNDRIFQMIERSNADLIGDGHFVDFKYSQGGCYFFKSTAIKKINDLIEQQTMDKLTKEIDIVVEDIAAYHFAKKLGLNTMANVVYGFSSRNTK